MSIENRKKINKKIKQDKETRILSGKMYKPTIEDYKNAFYEREEYENKNLGNFTKIYPLNGIV